MSAPAAAASTGDGREAALLDAAATVFATRGFSAATMQDVADALGVPKGSLYRHVASKQDLLVRLLERTHHQVDDVLADVVAIDGLESLERLELYVREMLRHTIDNVVPLTVYYHEVDRLPAPDRTRIYSMRRVHEDFVVDLISQAQRAGVIDPALHARLTGKNVFSTIVWLYHWWSRERHLDAEATIATCVRFALGSVRRAVSDYEPAGAMPRDTKSTQESTTSAALIRPRGRNQR